MGKEKTEKSRAGLMSMTGFGASKCEEHGVRIEVEIKTVNSRYLDVYLRFPRAYSQFEMHTRDLLTQFFSRGRVEVTVLRTPTNPEAFSGGVNRVIFEQLWKEQCAICKEVKMDTPEVRANLLAGIFQRREVLDLEDGDIDVEVEKVLLEKALREASEKVFEGRKWEGQKLQNDLLERLTLLENHRTDISQLHESQPEQYRERLEQKIEKILSEMDTELDEGRIAAEVAIYVDKIDIAEELVRLQSHIMQFREIIQKTKSGRKLGFLLQELLREFNTIASKAQNAEIQQQVVDARSEIERMREQVQNVE